MASVDDLMFFSRIQAACRDTSTPVVFVRSANEFFIAVKEREADLALVDLNFKGSDPFKLIARLKRDERTNHVRLVAFYSHVDKPLADEALRLGADACYPRSQFFGHIQEILQEA